MCHARLPMGFKPAVHFSQGTLLVLGEQAVRNLLDSDPGLDREDFLVEGWVDNLLLAAVSKDLCQRLVDEVQEVARAINCNIPMEQDVMQQVTSGAAWISTSVQLPTV